MLFKDNWKEAVNLIVLTPSTHHSDELFCNYSVLTVRGNPNNNLQVKSYVMPGGILESDDFSSKWWQLFDKFGLNSDLLYKRLSVCETRPPIVNDNILLQDLRRSTCDEDQFVTTDIALRIAGIRHLFKQTGILLVDPMNNNKKISSRDLSEWRERVRQSSGQFFEMCDQLNLKPDLLSLKEWWNWLTPSSVGRNTRFDTIYYLCFIDDYLTNKYQHWSAPKTLIDRKPIEGYFLSPPQIYEFSRLLNFIDFEEFKEFAFQRQKYGIDRWLPIISLYKDGAISFLPGDDLYPNIVELIATKPVRSYPQNLEDIKRKAIHLNRIELRGTDCKVIVNIDMTLKQVRPVSYYNNSELIPYNML